VQTAAIVSELACNTTLRVVEFQDWREADLALKRDCSTLQDHYTLQKIHLSAKLWITRVSDPRIAAEIIQKPRNWLLIKPTSGLFAWKWSCGAGRSTALTN
jgi:hypothetical protein